MRQSRIIDIQILAILKQNEQGVSAADLCREHGMNKGLFYKWRAKFGGMDASLMKRMKDLEKKCLKKIYAVERQKSKICRVFSRYSRFKMSLSTGAYLEYMQSISVTSYDGVRANSD